MLEKIRLKELNDLYGTFRYKDEIYKIISTLKDVDLIKGSVNRVIACKNKATGKYKIIDVGKNENEFVFCEYELNIGTYHPFLLSKKCYFNDFYEKDNHTYTCFTAEDGNGKMYPFEIKDYLYAGQDVIFKFDMI